jgi:hypothetical protein
VGENGVPIRVSLLISPYQVIIAVQPHSTERVLRRLRTEELRQIRCNERGEIRLLEQAIRELKARLRH